MWDQSRILMFAHSVIDSVVLRKCYKVSHILDSISCRGSCGQAKFFFCPVPFCGFRNKVFRNQLWIPPRFSDVLNSLKKLTIAFVEDLYRFHWKYTESVYFLRLFSTSEQFSYLFTYTTRKILRAVLLFKFKESARVIRTRTNNVDWCIERIHKKFWKNIPMSVFPLLNVKRIVNTIQTSFSIFVCHLEQLFK